MWTRGVRADVAGGKEKRAVMSCARYTMGCVAGSGHKR